MDAQVEGQAAGEREECADFAGAFHGGTVESTFNGDGAARVDGLQFAELLVELREVSEARDAEIDVGLGVGGDDVAAGAALDDAGVDGGAFGEVSEASDALDLMGKFDDGAGSLGEVDAGVGGVAGDFDGVAADAFAGGFEFTAESGAGLQDQDGGGSGGRLFGEGARDGATHLFLGDQ